MMNLLEINKRIKQRPPFQMIEKVLELEPNVSAKGIKNVSVNEPYFIGHFPETPIMPGVLLIECAAQLCSLVIAPDDAASDEKLYVLLKGEYARLQRVEILLERLHVIKGLDLSTMQKIDWETMNILMAGILDEKELALNVKESRLHNIKVGNLMFLLLVCLQKSGKFRIYDYFTPLSALKLISPEGYEASKYAVLEVDGYVRYDNIDFSNILPSISVLKAKHEYVLDYAKFEVFNMLKAYCKLAGDKEKSALLLNTSSDVIDWMIRESKDADEKLAYECYAYLVKFLKNTLSEEDIVALKGILFSDRDDNPLKADVALLLKNKSAFDFFYSMMTKEEIEDFKE